MESTNQEKIEAYLLNQLSEEEKTQFEIKLQYDAALQSATEHLRDLIIGITLFGEEQFRTKVQLTENNLKAKGFFLTTEKIDLYLKGEATPELQNLIEQRQLTDPDFQQKIQTQKDLLEGINQFGENNFLAQLQQTTESLEQESFFEQLQAASKEKIQNKKEKDLQKSLQSIPQKREAKIIQFNWRRTLSIAAAISGLLIGIWAISMFLQSTSPIQEHFLAYQDQLSPELEETGFIRLKYLDTLQLAMKHYNTRDYEAAIPLFRNFIDEVSLEDPYFPFAQFYLAQSLIATQSYEAAQTLLEALTSYSRFVWKEDVRWYLALVYLEREQFSDAQRQLDFLATSDKYFEQIKKIRKKYSK